MTQRQKLFLVTGTILLAAFLRFYRLNELPPGLHYDEAFNAVEAQRVLAGAERPIYFTGDLTEEPMAIYTASIFFWLFGASAFTLRLVSAFIGILTVAAIYFLASTFVPSPAKRGTIAPEAKLSGGAEVGVFAALILAILYWHINFSRLGMELIFLPLMLTLGMGFWFRATNRNVIASEAKQSFKASNEIASSQKTLLAITQWIFAAIFLSLALYTYKAALFVPIFLAAFLISEIIFNRESISRHWRGLGILIGVAVLVFAPLGLYWATHPGEFIERPSTVLTTPETYLQNAIQVSAMFFVRGDANPRSNLPGRPALDPLLAIGFIVGIVVSLARIKRTESRALLIWLGVMVLPSILTDYAPHFGRAIAALPAVALITAIGFAEIWVRAKHLLNRSFLQIKSARASQIFKRVGLANASLLLFTLYVLLFTLSTFSTFKDYFTIWSSDPGQFDAFDVGLLSLAQKLRARPTNETLFITPTERDYYTVQFGLAGRGADANSFDGSSVLVLPEPGSPATYGIVTRTDARSLARLQKIFPGGRVLDRIFDFAGQPYAVIFRAEGAGQFSPQKRVDAKLESSPAPLGKGREGGIALLGYDTARNGNDIALTLYWRCLAEMREDETVFVHVTDAAGRVIAQTDAKPGRGSYATTRWRAGQIIADDYVLSLPPGARGNFQIEIGMYVLETGARARVTDVSGAHMENDRVPTEKFTFP